VDNKQIALLSESNQEQSQDLASDAFNKSSNVHTLDLISENMGRPNGGKEMNSARKGVAGDVLIDDKVHKNWAIFPLEFKPDFVNKLKNEKWRPLEAYKSPALYRAILDIKDTPKDTFLKLDDWHTTVVFINGFNLGRYWNIGPAKTLYVPSGVLKKGVNDIYLFETSGPGNHIEFVDIPNLG
jgi:beta-galactosidase GanA